MNQVQGKVVLRGSNSGIPGLLVSVFEINPAAAPPCQSGEGTAAGHDELHYRLGSAVTNFHGAFALVYRREDVCGLNRQPRPDLMVVVSTPDEGCDPCLERAARLACCFRRAVASVESFLIPVDESRLVEAGIPIPGAKNNVEQVIEQRHETAQLQDRLRADARRLFAERLQARRELASRAETYFSGFLSALSAVPAGAQSARYVAQGTSVQSANQAMIQSGIQNRINPATALGTARLSDREAAKFQDGNGNFLESISGAEVEALLWSQSLGSTVTLVRATPLSQLCHEGPVDPCVEILEGKKPVGGEHEHPEPDLPAEDLGTADGETPAAPDIPLLIENLVQHMTPPESTQVFTVPNRAGLAEVQQGINGFTLHSGPADGPSLHDFHHLQIAFEHVWQELFDEGVVQKGKDLYTDLVELGLDPNEYLIDPGEKGIKINPQQAQDAGKPPLFEPPREVLREFDITSEQWTVLVNGPLGHNETLKALATDIADQRKYREEAIAAVVLVGVILPADQAKGLKETVRVQFDDAILEARRQGERILRFADHKLQEPKEFDHFHKNLMDLAQALKEPYRFSIYAANGDGRSVNFGIVATYRQKWEPVSYQVGELVKTIPLAPKEVRRFSKKVSVRKNRAEKEVENNLRSRRTESAETVRAETEIVQKAQRKTNFQLTAEGGVDVGIANAKGSTSFAKDAAAESQEVKKEFREAIFKAAEELKHERMLEVNVSLAEETSLEESGEISNPNDEIPVTYLFYELQRRYRISEQIHRVTPVVLVAQEFPKPSEIDEAWIIAHDWILRRVILDDSFLPAMTYLASRIVGDENALQEMYQNLQQQRRITEDLKDELVAIGKQVGRRYAALQRSIERRADAIEAEESEGFLEGGVEFLFGSNDASPEALRVREEAASDAYERAAKEEKEQQARLERETTALNALTETYTKELSEHLNRKTQISRLRVHIKANIMYYMQAIWSHEPPDQRFFRLHEVRVPKLKGKLTFQLKADKNAIPMPPDWKKPHQLVVKCDLDTNLEFATLEEAADLDNLLGFKGNYMMFPLKKSNVLTDFMMVPYLDGVTGIHDPDPLAAWTLTELLQYVCCLHKQLSKAEFEKLLPGLQAAYQQILNAPQATGEEIVVPTDSLFIEALPGVHPILEDFKLFHRVVDVKKVQAEVRGVELENLRLAARLLAGDREDPTIEKKIVIEGGESVIVPPDGN